MKIWMKIAVILFGIVLITFLLLNDYLPPRTPIKVAKIHSGLRISKSATVIYFKEDYAFTGEGQVEMKIKITKCKSQCAESVIFKLKYN
jgi:hypothetical protein